MRGIRGATQLSANTVPAIEDAVVELCRELEGRGERGAQGLRPDLHTSP